MDSSIFEDGVEQKKINVLVRYNLFQYIEVLIAVALIFVMKVSGDKWLCFPGNLFNQHVVFLVGNVIIVVCYVLSEKRSRMEKYDEKHSRKTTGDVSIGESATPAPKELPVMEEVVAVKTESEVAAVKTESETEMEVTIKQAVKQIERFRRTRSEKLKLAISIKPHRELQRSETEGRSRLLVASGDDRSPAMSSETVEKMSNEEFQLVVETFISKQQSLLKQECRAESGTKFSKL